MTFIDADSRGETEFDGGGAIWVRGGCFKVVNSRFFNNVCADVGPEVGGAGIRVFSQFEGRPVYVTNSTFGGGADFGNTCSNGGGISSINVSWTILSTASSPTTTRSETAATRPCQAHPAAAAVAPSTTTATPCA